MGGEGAYKGAARADIITARADPHSRRSTFDCTMRVCTCRAWLRNSAQVERDSRHPREETVIIANSRRVERYFFIYVFISLKRVSHSPYGNPSQLSVDR